MVRILACVYLFDGHFLVVPFGFGPENRGKAPLPQQVKHLIVLVQIEFINKIEQLIKEHTSIESP